MCWPHAFPKLTGWSFICLGNRLVAPRVQFAAEPCVCMCVCVCRHIYIFAYCNLHSKSNCTRFEDFYWLTEYDYSMQSSVYRCKYLDSELSLPRSLNMYTYVYRIYTAIHFHIFLIISPYNQGLVYRLYSRKNFENEFTSCDSLQYTSWGNTWIKITVH